MPAVAREFIINPEDQARSELYDFLGLVLARPADAALLGQIAGLRGDDTPLGNALDLLAKIAAVTRAETAEREFNALFIGLGRGELLPYASYYLTGFLNEKPLARLRQDMAERRIERAEGKHEPEDNIASLMEMMGGMIVGRFGKVTSVAGQKSFSIPISNPGPFISSPIWKRATRPCSTAPSGRWVAGSWRSRPRASTCWGIDAVPMTGTEYAV
ncbi:molecular chaperone [Roseibium salinum]|uniref:TorD/DmsD family molecular chaperone n=1 Tax=Roseibium salinum TaxID=1604349 RepID=UPI0036229AB6